MSQSEDAYFRLMYQVEGKAAIDAATEALRQHDDAAAALKQEYDAGNVSREKYEEGLRRISNAHLAAENALKQLTRQEKLTAQAAEEMAAKQREAAAAAENALEQLARQEIEAAQAAKKLAAEQREAAAAAHLLAVEAAKPETIFRNLTVSVGAAGAQIDDAVGKKGKGGMALLEFSRLAEDAQYGVAGILNNIPGLLMSLGQGAGLAGAISVVALAASQVYRHWDDITGLWDGGATETEAQRMERLEDATNRTAAETKELNAYKKEQARIEEQLQKFHALVPEEQKQRQQLLQATLAEEGPGALQKGVAQAMFRRVEPEIRAQAHRRSDILAGAAEEGRWTTAAEDAELEKIKARLTQLNKFLRGGPESLMNQASDLMGAAVFKGEMPAFRDIESMMAARPEEFTPGLMEGFRVASPEQMKLEKQGVAQGAQIEQQMAARKEFDEELKRRKEQGEREKARADQREEREIAAEERRKEAEKRRTEIADRARTAAQKAAGIAGMQAARQGAPEVEAMIGGIGIGPVATAKATQRALQQISAGNKNQMDAVMTAVQEVMNQANLMNFQQKAYAQNFLRMARQQRQRRTSPQG